MFRFKGFRFKEFGFKRVFYLVQLCLLGVGYSQAMPGAADVSSLGVTLTPLGATIEANAQGSIILTNLETQFVNLYNAVNPAVVSIQVTEELGFRPRFSTRDAMADYLQGEAQRR